MGPRTAQRLRETGIGTIDVSGTGGTSWVGVETMRAEGDAKEMGERLWDWGVPTAASIVYARRSGHDVIATGGIRTGLDVARAIALGAKVAGIARTVLQALNDGGEAGAEAYLDRVERELRAVLLLTGSRTLAQLERAPRVLRGELKGLARARSLVERLRDLMGTVGLHGSAAGTPAKIVVSSAPGKATFWARKAGFRTNDGDSRAQTRMAEGSPARGRAARATYSSFPPPRLAHRVRRGTLSEHR